MTCNVEAVPTQAQLVVIGFERFVPKHQSHGPDTSTVPPAVVRTHSADNDAGSKTRVESLKQRPTAFSLGRCCIKEQGTQFETSLHPSDVSHRPPLPVTASLIVDRGERMVYQGTEA